MQFRLSTLFLLFVVLWSSLAVFGAMGGIIVFALAVGLAESTPTRSNRSGLLRSTRPWRCGIEHPDISANPRHSDLSEPITAARLVSESAPPSSASN